jgi:hypothetical protein
VRLHFDRFKRPQNFVQKDRNVPVVRVFDVLPLGRRRRGGRKSNGRRSVSSMMRYIPAKTMTAR